MDARCGPLMTGRFEADASDPSCYIEAPPLQDQPETTSLVVLKSASFKTCCHNSYFHSTITRRYQER